jgi:hypothetical protein
MSIRILPALSAATFAFAAASAFAVPAFASAADAQKLPPCVKGQTPPPGGCHDIDPTPPASPLGPLRTAPPLNAPTTVPSTPAPPPSTPTPTRLVPDTPDGAPTQTVPPGSVPETAPGTADAPSVVVPPPTGDSEIVKKPPPTGDKMPVVPPPAVPKAK